MKKLWLLFVLFCAMITAVPSIAYATEAPSQNHKVEISWFYGRSSELDGLYNGEAGTKLGSTTVYVPNGTFNYDEYVKNPDGATYYQDYGVLPIIRINGNYYLLDVVYVEANSSQNQWNHTIDIDDSDTDIVIKLGYCKVSFAQPTHLDKIKISIDNSANENLTTIQTYQAYQILHVTKASSVQEDVTTDDTIGQPIGSEDAGFSYYVLTSDPWYSVITENMAD